MTPCGRPGAEPRPHRVAVDNLEYKLPTATLPPPCLRNLWRTKTPTPAQGAAQGRIPGKGLKVWQHR